MARRGELVAAAFTAFAAFALGGLTTPTAHAHPGVHERIDRATEAIDREPMPERHLERALLYLEHEELDAAAADVAAAERLGGATAETRWLGIRVAKAAGRNEEVLDRLAALGEEERARPRARLMESRALAALGRVEAAEVAMSEALAAMPNVPVELYLEAAERKDAVGRPEDARRVLGDGLGAHPDAVPLHVARFRLDRDRGAHETALADLDAFPQTLAATPLYLVERARIQRTLGHADDAQATYDRARQTLEGYPAARRRSVVMEDLAAAIDAESAALAGSSPATPAEEPMDGDDGDARGGSVGLPLGAAIVLAVLAAAWWWVRRREGPRGNPG